MKAEDKSTVKIVIELTGLQSEIFDRIIESVKRGNQGTEITGEIILTDICTTYIANEGGKLIKQG